MYRELKKLQMDFREIRRASAVVKDKAKLGKAVKKHCAKIKPR